MLSLIKTFINPDPISPVVLYPYEFPTSGFARVDKIRFLIEDQRDWDFCYDLADSTQANNAAAQRFGFTRPFSIEQAALVAMLTKVHAGPHMTTYAWGIYADIIQSETYSH